MAEGPPHPLEDALGYEFADPGLLRLALTHRSFTSESEADPSNERLEFLGDAVLGLVVADALLRGFDLNEGEMAKARADVVSAPALARVAESLGLGGELLLGLGEEASGGRSKPSILADAMEAVIGAVFVDGGLIPARTLILENWRDQIEERAAAPGILDWKTRLQEELAADGRFPSYETEGTGPDHERSFTAAVSADGELLGRGEGTSKKRAEQEAARAALEELDGPDA